MKINYTNTDVVYKWEDVEREDEDPDFKAPEYHSGRFIQTLEIKLVEGGEFSYSREPVQGMVLDYDESDNLIAIDFYALDMVMDDDSLKKLDDQMQEEFKSDHLD